MNKILIKLAYNRFVIKNKTNIFNNKHRKINIKFSFFIKVEAN